MKKIQLITFLIMLIGFSACQDTGKKANVEAVDLEIKKVEVIDFYGTHRCVTCKAIEANTQYTVETYFSDAVKKGLLEFKTINVDEEANVLSLKPVQKKISAYYNMDNGTGKVRGVYMQGNSQVAPIFREWLDEFKDLELELSTN